MANYQSLLDTIANNITTNGNNEITGSVLKSVLQSMVSGLGANATFGGIAHIADVPGTPDGQVVYIASEVGTYPNFGGLTIDADELAIFIWDTSTWTKESITYIADKSEMETLIQDGITDIGNAKTDALNAISTAIQGIDVTYTTIEDYNVQLKDSNSNSIYPQTNADLVDVSVGGSDVALSDRIVDCKYNADIDLTGLTIYNGYINTSGVYKTPSSTKSVIFPASQYRGLKMTITTVSTTGYYAFLRDNSGYGTADKYVCYCTEHSLVQLNSTTPTRTEVIPEDCEYIYMSVYNGTYYPNLTIWDDTDSLSVGLANQQIIGDYTPIIEASIYPKLLRYQGGKGYVRTSASGSYVYGSFTVSSSNWGIFIPFSDYRGKRCRVYWNPAGATLRYAFTKSAPTSAQTSSILCANTSVRDYSTIPTGNDGYFDEIVPSDCNYMFVYVYSGGKYYNVAPERIDIFADNAIDALNISTAKYNDNLLSDDDDMNHKDLPVARVFSHYFPSISSDDDLTGLDDATITTSGITLTAGVSTPITHNKIFVFDDEKITLEVTASTTDKILFYSSSSSGALSTEEIRSYVLFDFVNGKIQIYKAGTISTSDGTSDSGATASFTASSATYILTIGRTRREVFAEIYNKSTMESVHLDAVESQSAFNNTGQRPYGWMYACPSFLTLAGTPVYIKFCGYTRTGLNMLFQGDSYTQGYAGDFRQCWAYRAAKYFGNSRTCGMSGCGLSSIIAQYQQCIKGKVDVKNMVISIGINDMSSLTTDALIATWASTFKDYLDELVADGINPIVNRIWHEGSATASTATLATKMNNYIRSWGFDGADFGAVTGAPSNTTYYTNTHLSPKGNDLTYEIFINELAHYKQD